MTSRTSRAGRDVAVFVAPDGNGFMADIARWIVEAAALSGRRTRLVTDRLPTDDGSINLVVAPHEFYLLRDDRDSEIRDAGRISVPICTEQPGTPWFLMSLGLCETSPLVIDINETASAAIRAEGFDVQHLPLGAVPSMDRRRGSEVDLDVLFLGALTPFRRTTLAGLAATLWDRPYEIHAFSPSRPITGAEPGVVFGAAKYDLLARSRVLINVHRDEAEHGYFEWARMIEAMANGCVVVSQPSTGFEPLAPGDHFVETDDLPTAVDELLGEPDRLDRIAAAAASFVLEERPLARSLDPLLCRLDDEPPHARRRRRRARPIQREHAGPLMPAFAPNREARMRVYRAWLGETLLQREIDALRCRERYGTSDHVELSETSSYGSARPSVSVAVTLYNYADVVADTLHSITGSRDVDYEIVVVDDHSTDDGRAVVQRFMADHPDVPIRLVASDANRGLPTARNLAVEHARAELVMVIDADNQVYPNALAELRAALLADPRAAFAYSALEDFGDEPGVRSAMGWWVPWLCEQNYIDAQAMIRREALLRIGGYRHDDREWYGWEDWELWLRFAANGEHGVHVPKMLGRYRTHAASMISITNLAAAEMRTHLRELYPHLPWPEGSPS